MPRRPVQVQLDNHVLDYRLHRMRMRLRALPTLLRDYVIFQGIRAAGGVVRDYGKRRKYAFKDRRGWTRKSFKVVFDRRRLRVHIAYGGQGRSRAEGQGAWQGPLLEFGTKLIAPRRTLTQAFENTTGRQEEVGLKAMERTFNSIHLQGATNRLGTDLRLFIRARTRGEDY